MQYTSARRAQRGAITIFISIMMLIFMTLMVITAYTMSSVNLQAVNNAQVRNEAISSAQALIEQVVASPFTDNPAAAALIDQEIDVDGDGNFDYLVDIIAPVCVRVTRANTVVATSVTLPGMTAVDAWNTIWELEATATNAATGARVVVKQGVRKLLSNSEKNLVCS